MAESTNHWISCVPCRFDVLSAEECPNWGESRHFERQRAEWWQWGMALSIDDFGPPPCPGKQKQESWSREIFLIGPAYESQMIVRIGGYEPSQFQAIECLPSRLTATLTEPERDELRHFLGDAFSWKKHRHGKPWKSSQLCVWNFAFLKVFAKSAASTSYSWLFDGNWEGLLVCTFLRDRSRSSAWFMLIQNSTV